MYRNNWQRVNPQQKNKLVDVWVFTALIFIITIVAGFLKSAIIPLPTIPILIGVLSFLFWVFVDKKPFLEIYSKGYAYRKLKLWGAVCAIVFFEYILVRGLYTKQISLTDQHLYYITAALAGSVVYYFSFVRMRVSLRYLFLGIFIPLLASGTSVGLSRYFGFVKFSAPATGVGATVFLNTVYWVLFGIFYQLICEEPAFRGFLMQRLLDKGKTFAVIASSFIYALWYITIGIFQGINIPQGIVSFIEAFIVGCLLAVLFLKGKNLLIAAISHGIIEGLKLSLLASDKYPGLNQYFKITARADELKFIALWFVSLFIGLMLIIMIPQKKRAQPIWQRY